ncbi:NfeD family protein [Spirulina major]|uniref:NfeD family protein n=1 Tax=Spirulina major TaxID=270636 RepID=UPI0009355E5F|nr:NfeD family protein [Spirulina major]
MNTRFLVNQPQFFPTPIPGVITDTVTLDQKGRIRFQGSFYPAQLAEQNMSDELSPGTTVQVLGRLGITLLIRPV